MDTGAVSEVTGTSGGRSGIRAAIPGSEVCLPSRPMNREQSWLLRPNLDELLLLAGPRKSNLDVVRYSFLPVSSLVETARQIFYSDGPRAESHQVAVLVTLQSQQRLTPPQDLAGEGLGLAAGSGVSDDDPAGQRRHQVVAEGR